MKIEKLNEHMEGLKPKILDRLSSATNRSKGQTLFLLDLVDDDLFKLIELEEKIKNNHINYCPGDKEECERILAMDNGTEWFEILFTYKINDNRVRSQSNSIDIEQFKAKIKKREKELKR